MTHSSAVRHGPANLLPTRSRRPPGSTQPQRLRVPLLQAPRRYQVCARARPHAGEHGRGARARVAVRVHHNHRHLLSCLLCSTLTQSVQAEQAELFPAAVEHARAAVSHAYSVQNFLKFSVRKESALEVVGKPRTFGTDRNGP